MVQPVPARKGSPPAPADAPAPAVAPEAGVASANALAVRQVRRRGFAVGLATGLYGISFGALATAAGLDVWQAMVLSAVMFTGGSQFAFIGVIAAGGAPVGAAASAVLLGVRNTLYGLGLSQMVPERGARALVRAQLTIDESAATAASGRSGAEQRAGFWSAGIWVYVFWNVFSLAGALLGSVVSSPQAWGLDAAAAAAFLGLLWPRLRQFDTIAVAVAAAFTALLLTPALPAGLPVIGAALVAVIAGFLPSRPGPDGAATDTGAEINEEARA